MNSIEHALQRTGFTLARQRKHKVYKRDDGKTFVTPSTPSDCNWEKNAIATLARMLGIRKVDLTTPVTRMISKVSEVQPEPVAVLAPEPATEMQTTSAIEEILIDKKLERQLKRSKRREAKMLAEQTQKNEELFVLASIINVTFDFFRAQNPQRNLQRSLKNDIQGILTDYIPDFHCTLLSDANGRHMHVCQWKNQKHVATLKFSNVDGDYDAVLYWDAKTVGLWTEHNLNLIGKLAPFLDIEGCMHGVQPESAPKEKNKQCIISSRLNSQHC